MPSIRFSHSLIVLVVALGVFAQAKPTPQCADTEVAAAPIEVAAPSVAETTVTKGVPIVPELEAECAPEADTPSVESVPVISSYSSEVAPVGIASIISAQATVEPAVLTTDCAPNEKRGYYYTDYSESDSDDDDRRERFDNDAFILGLENQDINQNINENQNLLADKFHGASGFEKRNRGGDRDGCCHEYHPDCHEHHRDHHEHHRDSGSEREDNEFFGLEDDNQNINQNVNANQNLLADLAVEEFFDSPSSSGRSEYRGPSYIEDCAYAAAPASAPAAPFFGDEENFNMNNNNQFSEGFFGVRRGLNVRRSTHYGSDDEDSSTTTATLSNDHNLDVNQNLNNDQNVNNNIFKEGLGSLGGFGGFGGNGFFPLIPYFGGFRAFDRFGGLGSGRDKRDLTAVEGLQKRHFDTNIGDHGCSDNGNGNGNQNGNQNDNKNVNKNVNENVNKNVNINTPSIPVPVETVEYVPVVQEVPCVEEVPVIKEVPVVEKVPYVEYEVVQPTPVCGCPTAPNCGCAEKHKVPEVSYEIVQQPKVDCETTFVPVPVAPAPPPAPPAPVYVPHDSGCSSCGHPFKMTKRGLTPDCGCGSSAPAVQPVESVETYSIAPAAPVVPDFTVQGETILPPAVHAEYVSPHKETTTLHTSKHTEVVAPALSDITYEAPNIVSASADYAPAFAGVQSQVYAPAVAAASYDNFASGLEYAAAPDYGCDFDYASAVPAVKSVEVVQPVDSIETYKITTPAYTVEKDAGCDGSYY